VREADRAFVAEGAKLLLTALDGGAPLEGVYVAPEAEAHQLAVEVMARAAEAGVRVHRLGRGVMERVADTVSPQPVCGVVSYLDVPVEQLVASGGAILVCAGVRDPGNLGAVMRVAHAMGFGGVLCCETTVDPYNPKVVRASAGSIFRVRLSVDRLELGPGAALAPLRGAGYRLLATVAGAGDDYDQLDLTGRVAFLLGNEGSGLPDDVVTLADGLVTIPMEGGAESLNVAMSAAVLAATAASQRRRRL
jgi:TrmH family RNA methyltransferase